MKSDDAEIFVGQVVIILNSIENETSSVYLENTFFELVRIILWGIVYIYTEYHISSNLGLIDINLNGLYNKNCLIVINDDVDIRGNA